MFEMHDAQHSRIQLTFALALVKVAACHGSCQNLGYDAFSFTVLRLPNDCVAVRQNDN